MTNYHPEIPDSHSLEHVSFQGHFIQESISDHQQILENACHMEPMTSSYDDGIKSYEDEEDQLLNDEDILKDETSTYNEINPSEKCHGTT